MTKQLYYEDVEVGSELPSQTRTTTTRQLVMYAGAEDDYFEGHYDHNFAVMMGMKGVFNHGWLVAAFLGRMITDWKGDEGSFKSFRIQYRSPTFPSEPILCKGKVSNKCIKDYEHLVECDVWAENENGNQNTIGKVTFSVPTRSS
ncbi:MAG: MaoC/PaaZ C-terminal domain-containing protein [Thermodesulfobacteriota bacterium]|nr:MaoC/PaaZ C-terminal domain-containing protein [Thermodesulfobacteriota bacterium]